MQPRLVTSKAMFRGKRLRVERLTFSKRIMNDSHVVDVLNFSVPKSVGVLPITNNGKILLERHFRYPQRCELLEIPAGWMEKGERPVEAAKRELLEETGYSSKTLTSLGSIIPSSGYSTEELFLFLARVNENTKSRQRLEKGELISLVNYSKDRVLQMIKLGNITDPMTICALFRASLRGLC